ncbi:MAG: hypothetical protein ACTHZX_09195 [Microbacterium sp.]
MKMKKTIASTLATAALAAGLLSAGAPAANAVSHWSTGKHSTVQGCLTALGAKNVQLVNQGYKTEFGAKCLTKHYDWDYQGTYYYGTITYTR